MFLKTILGVSGIHTFYNFFVLAYTSRHPSKTKFFLVVVLENAGDLRKTFCVIMCYAVTAIKHTNN